MSMPMSIISVGYPVFSATISKSICCSDVIVDAASAAEIDKCKGSGSAACA